MINMGGDIWLQIFLLVNVFVIGVVLTIAVTHWRAHRQVATPASQKTDFPILPHSVQQRIIEEAESDYEKVLRRSAASFSKDLEVTTKKLSEQLSTIGNSIMDSEMARYKTDLDTLRHDTTEQLASADADISHHQSDIKQSLLDKQAALDQQLVEYRGELERTFTELQSNFTSRQAELEAELTKHQAEIAASLKERELKISHNQAALEASLVQRQQDYAAKQLALESQLEAEMTKRREQYLAELDTKLNDIVSSFLVEALGTNVDLGAQTPYLIGQLDAHKDDLLAELRHGG